MLHHASVAVEDLERSGRFYDALLGALGWRRQIDADSVIGWGIVRPVFFANARPGGAGGGHICFSASGIPAVKASWEEAVKAGGTDEGAPGPRPEYGGNSYYSAYVRDPDGNRVEIAIGGPG